MFARILLSLSGLVLLGAGVDHGVTGWSQATRLQAVTTAAQAIVAEVDERLVHIRTRLHQLASESLRTCDTTVKQRFADASLEVTGLRYLYAVDPTGIPRCLDVPSVGLVRGTDAAKRYEPVPGEALDLVDTGAKSARLLRYTWRKQSADDGYVALLVAQDLVLPLYDPAWTPFVRLRVTFAGNELIQIADGKTGEAEPVIADADGVESEGDAVTAMAASSHFPITARLSVASASFADRDLMVRAAIDGAAMVAALSLMAAVFLRRSEPDAVAIEIAVALRKGEFSAHYRPIFSLATGKLVATEIEFLWKRQDGRILAAHDFIPKIGNAGLKSKVFNQIFASCRSDVSMIYRLRPTLDLWVSISSDPLTNKDVLAALKHALTSSGIRLHQIVLGIEETSGVDDFDAVKSAISELNRSGVKFALRRASGTDSAESQFFSLGLGAIEIDERLTDALSVQSGSNERIVQAERWIADIVEIGLREGLVVAARGVKTAEQARRLRQLGVDLAQGPVFTPALTAGSFMALVTRMGIDQKDSKTHLTKAA